MNKAFLLIGVGFHAEVVCNTIYVRTQHRADHRCLESVALTFFLFLPVMDLMDHVLVANLAETHT